MSPCHNRPRRGAALAGLTVLLTACSPGPANPPNRAQVIAADGVLCDLSQRLAGSDLVVRCLLGPKDDPHRFQLTPSQTRALHEAPLVLINGYGLTPGLQTLQGSVAVAELAVPGSPWLARDLNSAHGHGENHTHDNAHTHGDRDPHVWHDPRQAAAMVRLVSQRLQALEPAAASRIQRRAAAMEHLLNALHQWNRRQFATIPGPAVLATGHRAFASLARAYQLQELPLVDGASSSDVLRPQALNAVIEQLKQQRVPSLLAQQRPPSRAMARISTVSGIPLAPQPVIADGLAVHANGQPADLITTLTRNTCVITESLQGRCDQAQAQQLTQQWQNIR